MIECKKCGAMQPDDTKFCGVCGAKVEETNEVVKENKPENNNDNQVVENKKKVSIAKKWWFWVIIAVAVIGIGIVSFLIIQHTTAQSAAKNSVDAYNQMVGTVNEQIDAYNASVVAAAKANDDFQTVIDEAKADLALGLTPYDEKTKTDLEKEITNAENSMVEIPSVIESPTEMTCDDNQDTNGLVNQAEEADKNLSELESIKIDAPVALPDYSKQIETLNAAKTAYDASVKKLSVVVGPSTPYVKDKLEKIDSVGEISVLTTADDKEKVLSSKGITDALVFSDSLVDTSKAVETATTSTGATETKSIDLVGVDKGGMIEIYDTVENATARLKAIENNNDGDHIVIGSLVVRISKYVNESARKTLINQIKEQMINN